MLAAATTRIRREVDIAYYNWSCRYILKAPPLRITPGPLRIVSMVGRNDFIKYLIAIYSFYKRIGYGHVVVLDDGTLTAEQRAICEVKLQATMYGSTRLGSEQ